MKLSNATCYYFGPFALDAGQHRLERGGSNVQITRKAFDLLLMLLQRTGETVSSDELIDALWPTSEETEDATLRQHVLMVRRALGDRIKDPRYVATDYGKGYRFIGAVSAVPSLLTQALVEQLCAAASEFRESRSPAAMKGALDLYDRALSLDPDSATALGGVALCRCLVADYMYECPKPLLQAARIAADKALVIEPGCIDALLALTKVRLDYDWNFDSALATIQKAVPLAPNNRIALFLNAWVLVLMGRFADAHSFLGTCTHDFPGAELVRVCRGVALLYERNFADAIAELSTACARWPHFWFGHLSLGQALFLSGEVQRAIQKFDWIRLSEFDPLIDGQVNVRFLAEGYAMYARFRSNDASGAQASLDRLRRLSQRQFIPATCFALAELGRRQYAKALSYIRQSGENRESWYTHLGIEPFVDDVRSDAKRYAV